MILGTRENVSQYEEKLLKLLGPMSNSACARKKHRNPEKFATVRQLCQIAKLDTEAVSPEVQEKLDSVVSQVCRAGSRFTKGCICVQFYEDSDQVMRWAIAHGALLCITRSQIDGIPCIVAEDPVSVYADMCKYFRDMSDIEVTAVVGSIGKTTTKRMIYAIYAAQYPTFADPENENQINCVGYICQHIPKKCVKQVQEVSEDIPGSVGFISHMLSPKIAVVTAIDKSHIEEFGDENKILEEIASVTKGMPKDGKVIVNIDDSNTKNLIQDRTTVTVSLDKTEADYYAEDIRVENVGLQFHIVEKASGNRYPITLHQVYAKHNVYSALYAFAAGVCAGVSIENILKGLSVYRTVGIRQNVYKTGETVLYVDCYNAVARSVRSAITAASEIPVAGKRVAVLGDVEEAGTYSEAIHREIIGIVNDSNFHVLLAYGPKMIQAAKETKVRGDLKVICCESREMLNAKLKQYVGKGDLACFKASRKSALEKSIAAVWPVSYWTRMVNYYLPIIKWRMKVINS